MPVPPETVTASSPYVPPAPATVDAASDLTPGHLGRLRGAPIIDLAKPTVLDPELGRRIWEAAEHLTAPTPIRSAERGGASPGQRVRDTAEKPCPWSVNETATRSLPSSDAPAAAQRLSVERLDPEREMVEHHRPRRRPAGRAVRLKRPPARRP